jgi:hypothetical protein
MSASKGREMAYVGSRSSNDAVGRFPHPVCFWLGVLACATGVVLHLPMYFSARDMGYHLAGMTPDAPMVIGMVTIVVGLCLATRSCTHRPCCPHCWSSRCRASVRWPPS